MEKVFVTWRRHWRRKKYQRLIDASRNKRNVKVTRFGGDGQNQRRTWKVKPRLKLKTIIVSPLKIWRGLKNAYVEMMNNLAGNVGYLNTNKVFGNRRIPKGREGKIVYSSEEIESRLVYEIYKALAASQNLGPIS